MSLNIARMEEIFGEAVAIPAAARTAYLDQACGGDVELRGRVEQLLAAHDATGNFLKLPEANGTTGPYVPLAEGPKSKIGRYKLLEQIGEGGFGVVFMAEQEEPVRRMVALKIIKLGMDTHQVVARFEAERQALAMMDHPSVAKVLDGGATETGRPYFVMELVKGVPITEYCDKNHLTISKRLELFLQVCLAVQHAHQKGLIHRDIKPSNVLVSTQDDRPVAKVIDFGVAKAMQARLTEKTLFTEFQQLVGTPAYMSPEQADGSLDIDTRSDVYALGVLLYELLAGSTPFDPKQLRSKAFAEMQRIIREVEPPMPSTRLSALSTSGEPSRTTSSSLPLAGRVGEGVSTDLASIAAQRSIEPRKLAAVVRGELDWIVMRALEKDRKRRYQMASSLSDDLQRYLTDQPVEANPPSALYRLRKFARRNTPGLAVAALLLAILILLGGGGGWMLRDRTARQSALEQSLTRLLDESHQWQSEGKWPEALAAVGRAETLVGNSGGSAAPDSRVQHRLADLHMLSKLDDIRGLCESGEELADFTRGDADQAYAAAFQEFGIDVNALDAQDSASRIRARSVPIDLAAALDHWALIRKWQHRELDAQRLLTIARAVDKDYWRDRVRDALQVADRESKKLLELAAVAPPHELLPATLVLLGTALESGDRRDEAFEFLSKAQRKYPNDFWINWRLASCALLLDRWDDTIRFYSVAVALRPDRPEAYARLGGALGQNMRLEEGIADIKKAIRIRPDYPRAYASLTWLLATHPDTAQRRPTQAIEYAQKGVKLQPQHPNSWSNLGVAYYAAGDWGKAADALEKANRMASEKDYFHRYYLAMARWQVGSISEAREAFQQGSEWMEKKHQPHQEILLRSRAEAAELLGISEATPVTEAPSRQ
jgi:serine/threonine protein kinase/Flp pilus assembly protein TadD